MSVFMHDVLNSGMEKVLDHGTIGPRKKSNSQKILPKEK